MKVLISGASAGIGAAAVNKFLAMGHDVVGLDIAPATCAHPHYTHLQADVRGALPHVDDVQIVVAAAGVQDEASAIDVNLMGVVNTVQTYAMHAGIYAVVTVASASARNGAEFALYAASKGAVVTYTKNLALQLAPYGATANSISPGGVLTSSNAPVLDDPALRQEAIGQSLLGKWATPDEIAEWIYFVAVVNRSMTGEDILVDNGEMLRSHFVWPQ